MIWIPIFPFEKNVMHYLSLFSGIEAATVACDALDWTTD